VIERAVIMAGEGEIQLRHIPGAAATVEQPLVAQEGADNILQVPVGTRMSDVEDAYVRLTLKYTNNNKKRAAELLGVCLRTLHNKLQSRKARIAIASQDRHE
jgi:DNA-binding NtrC family response regulator